MKMPQPEVGFKELQRLQDRLVGRLSLVQLVPARPEESLPAGTLVPPGPPPGRPRVSADLAAPLVLFS